MPSTSSNDNSTAISSDIFIYGVSIIAAVAIGISVFFFGYNKKYPQAMNKGPSQRASRAHGATCKTTKATQHALDMIVKKPIHK